MLIAHISATHISARGQKTYGIAPMAENLARCIEHINTQSLKPDLVLLSGDVTHDASHQEAVHAAEILAALECPLYLVPGNHDDRDVIWDVFGGSACPSKADGFINYVVETGALRLIGLDSCSGRSGGMICERRAAWLRGALAQGGLKPTLIFMHHPPLKCGVQETDIDGFANVEMLQGIVADYPNIERILCGHIHLLTHSRWQGTLVTTAPSMGMLAGSGFKPDRSITVSSVQPGLFAASLDRG